MGKHFLRSPNNDNDSGPKPQKSDHRLGDIQEVDQRRHEVLDYMLLQMNAEEIAQELDEEVYTIENDINHIKKVGFKGREEDLAQIRAEVVSKLRYTWTKGRKEFEESKKPQVKKTTKYGEGGDVTGNGDQNIEEEKVTEKEQVGDAKFLQVMNDSAEKMAKVTGAQKHKEVEINNNMQHNTTNILSPDRSTMPEEFDQFLDKPEDKKTPEERREAGLDDIENADL